MSQSTFLATLAATGLCLFPCALAEEGHVLAVKGKRYDRPVGTKITLETTVDLEGATMTVTTPKENAEGTMTRHDSFVTQIEILAPGKFRRIKEKEENKGVMTLNGQEQPAPGGQPDPLLGVPVITEEKDGKITSTLEQGSPTPEQEKGLAALSREDDGQDRDVLRYGEVPRKPGDKWELDPKFFQFLTSAQVQTGKCTMEFLKVEEFAGTPCAVLKVVYEASGEPARAKTSMKISFKGEGIIHRSLAERLDLETRMEGTMTMEMQPNPQVKIVSSGPSTTVFKATLKKP